MALRDEYRTLSAPGLDVRAAMIKQANGQALDAYELRALARRQMAERQFRASGGGTIKDSIGDLAADNPTIRLAMQRSLATARGREMGELSGRYGTDRIAQAQQVNYDALRAELERRRLSNEAAQVSNSTMAERIAADIRAKELQNEARAFDNSTMAERYERETAESDVRASINKQRLDDLLYKRSLRDEDRTAEVAQRAATLRATEARALGERLRTEIDRGRLAHQAREFELADRLKEQRLELLNRRAQEPRRQSEYESLVGLYVSALSDSRDESLSQVERDEALTRAQLYKERMDMAHSSSLFGDRPKRNFRARA